MDEKGLVPGLQDPREALEFGQGEAPHQGVPLRPEEGQEVQKAQLSPHPGLPGGKAEDAGQLLPGGGLLLRGKARGLGPAPQKDKPLLQKEFQGPVGVEGGEDRLGLPRLLGEAEEGLGQAVDPLLFPEVPLFKEALHLFQEGHLGLEGPPLPVQGVGEPDVLRKPTEKRPPLPHRLGSVQARQAWYISASIL